MTIEKAAALPVHACRRTLIAAVAATLAACSAPAPRHDGPPSAPAPLLDLLTVQGVQGGATMLDERRQISLKRDMVVFENRPIQVGARSTLRLALGDRVLLELGPNSRLVVHQLPREGTRADHMIGLRLEQGYLHVTGPGLRKNAPLEVSFSRWAAKVESGEAFFEARADAAGACSASGGLRMSGVPEWTQGTLEDGCVALQARTPPESIALDDGAWSALRERNRLLPILAKAKMDQNAAALARLERSVGTPRSAGVGTSSPGAADLAFLPPAPGSARILTLTPAAPMPEMPALPTAPPPPVFVVPPPIVEPSLAYLPPAASRQRVYPRRAAPMPKMRRLPEAWLNPTAVAVVTPPTIEMPTEPSTPEVPANVVVAADPMVLEAARQPLLVPETSASFPSESDEADRLVASVPATAPAPAAMQPPLPVEQAAPATPPIMESSADVADTAAPSTQEAVPSSMPGNDPELLARVETERAQPLPDPPVTASAMPVDRAPLAETSLASADTGSPVIVPPPAPDVAEPMAPATETPPVAVDAIDRPAPEIHVVAAAPLPAPTATEMRDSGQVIGHVATQTADGWVEQPRYATDPGATDAAVESAMIAPVPPPPAQWIVNVASHTVVEIAQQQAQDLIAKNYPASVRQETVRGRTSYRVVVEGLPTEAAAQSAARDLASREGLRSAWVLRKY